MSKRVLLFVLASVLMTFCISAQDYAVKGSVWDFDTAEPISSAAVLVYQITGNDTTFYGGCSTDDNGSFIIGQLKAGNYVLYAKSDNYFNTSKSFTLSSENVKDLGKITMRAGKGDLDPAITAVVAKIVDYFPENVYVDLGLSVKWATCNVGADKPEDAGDHYAWGEVETKDEYTWSNYKFNHLGELSKYNSDDKKTSLDPEDDVAHVKWGGSWRMPTHEEFVELKNNCTWTWYENGNSDFGGVAGFKVTGKREGYTDRFIFLPVTESSKDRLMNYTFYSGKYWSSNLHKSVVGDANYLDFMSETLLYTHLCYRRYFGYSVRPVCP